jgi:hypothetical protein
MLGEELYLLKKYINSKVFLVSSLNAKHFKGDPNPVKVGEGM